MAFIQLSDNYIDHPKFLALSDGAFRLWHEGMAYCRRHQTDGLIPLGALHGFRYYKPPRLTELATPFKPEAHPLWSKEKRGYTVHDYLYWNASKAEAESGRVAATARMRRWRDGRDGAPATSGNGVRDGPVTPFVTPSQSGVTNAFVTPSQSGVTNAFVLERRGEDLSLEESEKPLRHPSARSKRPIFKGQRLVVFEWQLDDFLTMLGNYAESFDLHAWFYALDARVAASNLVVPKRDNGRWLQAELLAEAQSRGLPIAGSGPIEDPYATLPTAWECAKCGQIHEGTAAEFAQGKCLNHWPGEGAE